MKTSNLRKGILGFSLVELMTVVAIVGILAATAAPAFIRSIRMSRTTEAISNLRNIFDGQSAYFVKDHFTRDGVLVTPRFVTAPQTPPTVPTNKKLIGNFNQPEWVALSFAQDSPVNFSYLTVATGIGTGSAFTARAIGDQDGDGVQSLFERMGEIDPSSGEISGTAGVYIARQVE